MFSETAAAGEYQYNLKSKQETGHLYVTRALEKHMTRVLCRKAQPGWENYRLCSAKAEI
jgi:hypothetical protein